MRQLGFGGNRYRETAGLTYAPGRLGLVLAALGALGLIGIGTGIWHRFHPPDVKTRPSDPWFDTPTAGESILWRMVVQPDGGYRITLGTARHFEVASAESGERLTVVWSWRSLASETRVGDWRVWRAGIWAAPLPSGDPLLRGYQDDPAVRRLALRLLDSGSAQAMAFPDLGTTIADIAELLPKLLAPGLSHQLVLIHTTGPGQEPAPSGSAQTAMSALGQGFDGPYAWLRADAADLTRRLDFPGWQALDALCTNGSFRLAYTQGTPKLRGRAGKVLTDSTRAPFVVLPGGSFVMGSPEEEPERDSDEGPWHQVQVPDFAIMATEVTNAQYAAFLNAAGRRGTQDRLWFRSQAEDPSSRIEGNAGAWRAKAGFGAALGGQCLLVRAPSLLCPLRGAPAHGSGVGICRPGGHHYGLVLRRRCIGHRSVCLVRKKLGE